MQEKAFYRGGTDWTFQPAQDRGQRACWKAASSVGRRVPLLIPSLVSSGKKLRGPKIPALCCQPTFVCLCVCLRPSVFVCVLALSLVSLSSGVSFSTLSSDLFSFSPSSLICPQLLLFSGVSVNRQMVVGAIDESQPGLHWWTLKALQ